MRNDFDERDEMNAIQRERMERRRNTRRKSVITTAVFAGVGVLVVGLIIFAVVNMTSKNKGNTTETAAITATISTGDADNKAANKSETTSGKNNASAQNPTTGQSATQPAQANSTDAPVGQNANSASGVQNSTDAVVNQQGQQNQQSQQSQQGQQSGAVEGGNVLHYYANGQTSYGYDWTYSGGGGVVSIYCTYDFNSNTYDFSITGVSEGTTSFTLYYNTSDGEQVPVPMTVSVDSSLNVTQIG